MAQRDVLEFLQEKRRDGDNWFTIDEIRDGLREKGINGNALRLCRACVRKLAVFDIIEFKGMGVWNHYKVFRAKKD